MLFYSKAIALTAFAMTAGAGCCYHMAQDEPYTMPVDTVFYEFETLSAQNETPKHENETFHPKMITVDETQVAPVQPIYDIPLSAELQHDIRELAEHYEISLELVLAVIMTESSGKVDTIGDGGASVGLMQIQPRWYGELITESGLSVDKPIENVELGIRILLEFIEENNGSLDRALKQYNSGSPDYEGNEYIEQVYEWLNYFEEAN
jgi:soluble lytic murein transglycosylase-like protein